MTQHWCVSNVLLHPRMKEGGEEEDDMEEDDQISEG
jgi:hypothetical protein